MMPLETVVNTNMKSSSATDVGRWTLDSMGHWTLDTRCCTRRVFTSCQPWTHNVACITSSASHMLWGSLLQSWPSA